METDNNSFVPISIQKNLVKLGWRLRYSSFNSTKVCSVFPDGKTGMQSWEIVCNDSYYLLDIHYTTDSNSTPATLWLTPSDTLDFKLRNIISVLKRKGLYTNTEKS